MTLAPYAQARAGHFFILRMYVCSITRVSACVVYVLMCVQCACNLGEEGGIFVTTTNTYWFIEDELQIFQRDCHLCGAVLVLVLDRAVILAKILDHD